MHSEVVRSQSGSQFPAVFCPKCGLRMTPTEKRVISANSAMVMVTYICSYCEAEACRICSED